MCELLSETYMIRVQADKVLVLRGLEASEMSRMLLVLLLSMCFSRASTTETQPVVVKSRKSDNVTILFEIDFRKRTLEMFCVVRSNVCHDLAPGKYLMTLSLHPVYTDCTNVDVYRDGADPSKSEPLGTYGMAYGLWKSN